jgi:hypothetical protein
LKKTEELIAEIYRKEGAYYTKIEETKLAAPLDVDQAF